MIFGRLFGNAEFDSFVNGVVALYLLITLPTDESSCWQRRMSGLLISLALRFVLLDDTP
jgi:hypothetical protein